MASYDDDDDPRWDAVKVMQQLDDEDVFCRGMVSGPGRRQALFPGSLPADVLQALCLLHAGALVCPLTLTAIPISCALQGRHLDQDDMRTIRALTRMLRQRGPPNLASLSAATGDLLHLLDRLLKTAHKPHDGAPSEGFGVVGAAPGMPAGRGRQADVTWFNHRPPAAASPQINRLTPPRRRIT